MNKIVKENQLSQNAMNPVLPIVSHSQNNFQCCLHKNQTLQNWYFRTERPDVKELISIKKVVNLPCNTSKQIQCFCLYLLFLFSLFSLPI